MTMPPALRACAALALLCLLAGCGGRAGGPVVQGMSRPADTRLLYCVPYARERANIDLRGDGWQWWEAATGRYARTQQPEVGAVLVFNRTNRLQAGHVAVVTRVVSSRELRVDHANWDSRRGGGPVATDQPVLDVSPGNDWTLVRVWYPAGNHLGSTAFATAGFVLPRPPGEPPRRT